jgi:serine/threonine protein kinase
VQADGVVLVQEFADEGDLLQLIMRSGAETLSEQTTTHMVLTPLLRAIYYMHSKQIIHRYDSWYCLMLLKMFNLSTP